MTSFPNPGWICCPNLTTHGMQTYQPPAFYRFIFTTLHCKKPAIFRFCKMCFKSSHNNKETNAGTRIITGCHSVEPICSDNKGTKMAPLFKVLCKTASCGGWISYCSSCFCLDAAAHTFSIYMKPWCFTDGKLSWGLQRKQWHLTFMESTYCTDCDKKNNHLSGNTQIFL